MRKSLLSHHWRRGERKRQTYKRKRWFISTESTINSFGKEKHERFYIDGVFCVSSSPTPFIYDIQKLNVAGLGPIEGIPNVHNIDLTTNAELGVDLVYGHDDYCTNLHALLYKIGNDDEGRKTVSECLMSAHNHLKMPGILKCLI